MKNHSIKAVCLVVFFILVIVFSGSCGGGGGGEEGGGDVNQPQLQGQVNLPISVPLQKIMVIAGLEQVGVSGDGIFSITANRDVTQVLMITDGENLLGMQTIPDTSNPTQVNITARTTAETLIFLAPFIDQGTVEENAQVLEIISRLPQVDGLVSIIESRLSANSSFFNSLENNVDQEFLDAYVTALEALYSNPDFIQITSTSSFKQFLRGFSIQPSKASGVSIEEDSSTPVENDFIGSNRLARYVHIYDDSSFIVELDPLGWLTFPPFSPDREVFSLNFDSRQEIILKAYGLGVSNLPPLFSEDFNRLLNPSIKSVFFNSLIPAINAIFGVTNLAGVTILDEVFDLLLAKDAFIVSISNDLINGDLVKVGAKIFIESISILTDDFAQNGVNSVIVKYVGQNVASGLLGFLFIPIKIASVGLNATQVILSLFSFAATSAVEEFRITLVPPPIPTFVFAESGVGGDLPPSRLFLVEISSDGVDTLIGTIRTQGGFEPVITDLALASDGTLFGVSFDTLYEIDPVTAISTPIVIGLEIIGNVNALTFDSSDNLFGTTADTGAFFRIDPTTGFVTIFGFYGSGFTSSGDLAFSPDGTLFASVNAPGIVNDILVIVNPASGDATPIMDLGFDNVLGLSFVGEKLFGFTSNLNDGSGVLIQIDPFNRTSTFIRSLSFDAFGAANSTH